LNQKVLAGVDEAGRGPLAGPVVAAAVVLNPADIPEGLRDSKKISEKKGANFQASVSQLFDLADDAGILVNSSTYPETTKLMKIQKTETTILNAIRHI